MVYFLSLTNLMCMKTKRGKQDVTFTAVGYGMQKSFPTAAGWKDQSDYNRWVAYPKAEPDQRPWFYRSFLIAAIQ